MSDAARRIDPSSRAPSSTPASPPPPDKERTASAKPAKRFKGGADLATDGPDKSSASPPRASGGTPTTDSCGCGTNPSRAMLDGPQPGSGPSLVPPASGNRGVVRGAGTPTLSGSGATTGATAGTDGVRSAQAASTAAPAIPPGYVIPEDAERVDPDTAGKVGAGFGIALLAIPYLIFAILAAIPALIAGLIEAPQADQANGDGTFYKGFARVFKAIMGTAFIFVQWPMQQLINKVSSPMHTFYIDRRADNDRIISIRIHLRGEAADVERMRGLEADVERNLAIPGYRVNVEFVDQPGDGVAEVEVNREVWSNYVQWNPYTNDDQINANDAHMMAHETMHLLGLRDEYCACEHFTNPQMDDTNRFGVFLSYLIQEDPPADAETGMMANSWADPLPRHYEAILDQA